MVEACREALDCALCRERAAALSPFAVEGTHDSTTDLPDNVVEVVHRIRTDSGRLTESWFDRMMDTGLSETEYVEIVGVVSVATALDTLAKGLGIPPRPLPEPVPGSPSRHRPANARRDPRMGRDARAGGRHGRRSKPLRRQDARSGRQHPPGDERRPGGGRGLLRARRRRSTCRSSRSRTSPTNTAR